MWLDSVLAEPAVGLRIQNSYRVAADVAGPLREFLDGLERSAGPLKFASPNPWDFDALAPNGFRFNFHTDNLVVTFSYTDGATVKAEPGKGLRVNAPDPRPYSKLLHEALEYVAATSGALAGRANAVRIGFIAKAILDGRTAPPGVRSFQERLSGVTGQEPIRSSCRLFTSLSKTAEFEDRCHHNLTTPDDDSGAFELVLDYQRYWQSPQAVERMGKEAVNVAELATAYFERFGSGATE